MKGGMKGEKVEIKLLHSNLQGFVSKQFSIDEILTNKNPDVYCVNETALKGKRKIKIKNYFSFCRNREKHMGGVATLVANYLRPNTVKVAEGKDEDEYIITRLDHVYPPINVVNIYGEQEKGDEERGKRARISESWRRLQDELEEIENRNENVVIIGDMNRAVGSGDWGVPGNKPNISYGGHLLRDLFSSKKYILMNSLPLAEGGPWTWVDRSDNEVKSCLDMGIMSAGLLPFLTTFLVDSDQKFTPRRMRRTRKGLKSIYSDHYSLELVLTGLPRARREKEQERESCTWNLRKEGGWERFKELTEVANVRVQTVLDDENATVEECMKKIKAIENKVKFQAFGKTRKTTGKNKVKESKDCTICRGLEAGPQGAQGMVCQGSLVDSAGGLEGGLQPAEGLDVQASLMGIQEELHPEAIYRGIRQESGAPNTKQLNIVGSTPGLVGVLQPAEGLEGEANSRRLAGRLRPTEELDSEARARGMRICREATHARQQDDKMSTRWLGGGLQPAEGLDVQESLIRLEEEHLPAVKRDSEGKYREMTPGRGTSPTKQMDDVVSTPGQGGGLKPAEGLEGQASSRKPAGGMKVVKQCEKCSTDEEKSEKLMTAQSKKCEDIVNEIKNTTKVRLGRIFKLKDEIMGGKKSGQEPTAMKDPDTGELLVSGKEIKKATLKYCINNLKNNKVSENVREIVKLKENLHNIRMNQETKDEFQIEVKEFDEVVKKFASKDTKSYDFLIKAGDGFKQAIGRFCARMIDNEKFPDEFRKNNFEYDLERQGTCNSIQKQSLYS